MIMTFIYIQSSFLLQSLSTSFISYKLIIHYVSLYNSSSSNLTPKLKLHRWSKLHLEACNHWVKPTLIHQTLCTLTHINNNHSRGSYRLNSKEKKKKKKKMMWIKQRNSKLPRAYSSSIFTSSSILESSTTSKMSLSLASRWRLPFLPLFAWILIPSCIVERGESKP